MEKPSIVSLSSTTAKDTKLLLRVAILAVISAAAIASRLFSVVNFESIIHEFDPWYVLPTDPS